MKMRNKITHALGLYTLMAICAPTIAFAYIDPGAGSALLTGIIGVIGAVGFYFRTIMFKISHFWKPSETKVDSSEKSE